MARQFKRLFSGRALQPFVFCDSGIVIAIGHNNAVGALMNSRLIVDGWMVRSLYHTIFRLHQQVLFGWVRVTSLIIQRRLKCAFNPHYTGV